MEARIVIKVSTLVFLSAAISLASFVVGMIAEYLR